ncbi:MAG: hypothetical protein ABSF55_02210 [Candidatus Staskawiczbacteria bacterium]
MFLKLGAGAVCDRVNDCVAFQHVFGFRRQFAEVHLSVFGGDPNHPAVFRDIAWRLDDNVFQHARVIASLEVMAEKVLSICGVKLAGDVGGFRCQRYERKQHTKQTDERFHGSIPL